jgi:hypothetical protein
MMAWAVNLLVVDGTPFVPDVVESHPGADDIRWQLIPHNESILEPYVSSDLQAFLQQPVVL